MEKLLCAAAPGMCVKDVVASLGCLSTCFGSGGSLNSGDSEEDVADSFTGLDELLKPHPVTLQTLLVHAARLVSIQRVGRSLSTLALEGG